ncbi:MAG: CapA family protein [Dehalococcoidia bacterium]
MKLPFLTAAFLTAALLATAIACSNNGDSSSTPTAEATTTIEATATSSAPARTTDGIALRDPAERERVRAALDGLTAIEVSDDPLSGGAAYTVQTWAVVTGQRSDVLELTLAELRRILRGEITDWSALGGAPLPLTIELPADGAAAIAAALEVTVPATAVTRPLAEVLADVAAKPGVLAVVPVSELRLGALALVVEGHDPYRDPATQSPLRAERWLRASDTATATEAARRLGWDAAPPNPAGLLATGDYIPARCAWSSAVADGGPLRIFHAPGMRDLLRAADLTVVPLEVGLMTSSDPTPCVATTVLQGPASAVDALADAGVDVLTRASNHALDCYGGCSGVLVKQETDSVLEAAGIPSVGIGNGSEETSTALVVERDGVRFALLAYDDIAPWYHSTPGGVGTGGLDLDTLAADVRAAKARADHVLVAIHAGIEYQAEPTDRQREAARTAIEAGATLVIGNHPHWVQATERITSASGAEGFVVYALGNFVFDQPWSTETQQGMLLEAGFTRDRLIGVRLRPHMIRDRYRPTLLDPATEGAPVLSRVWAATDALLGPR